MRMAFTTGHDDQKQSIDSENYDSVQPAAAREPKQQQKQQRCDAMHSSFSYQLRGFVSTFRPSDRAIQSF